MDGRLHVTVEPGKIVSSYYWTPNENADREARKRQSSLFLYYVKNCCDFENEIPEKEHNRITWFSRRKERDTTLKVYYQDDVISRIEFDWV